MQEDTKPFIGISQMDKPDSLKELRILQKRKEHFTKLFRAGKLPFIKRTDVELKCVQCGGGPHFKTEWNYDRQLNKIPGSEHEVLVTVFLLDLEDEFWCSDCFSAHWCIVRPPKPGASSSRPSVPQSDRDYHGGQWNQGEW